MSVQEAMYEEQVMIKKFLETSLAVALYKIIRCRAVSVSRNDAGIILNLTTKPHTQLLRDQADYFGIRSYALYPKKKSQLFHDNCIDCNRWESLSISSRQIMDPKCLNTRD